MCSVAGHAKVLTFVNILVFGHAGVGRRRASQNLVNGLADAVPRIGYFAKKTDAELVPATILEDELEIEIVSFLDLDDRRVQQRLWDEAARRAIGKVKSSAAVHRVVTLHATYYRQARTWSCLNPQVFIQNDFRPDVAVTLIDDVQNVQNRLEFTPGSPDALRLRELITWRNVEISDADFFLRSTAGDPKGAKNFVLGIRHPVKTAVDLLVEATKPAMYSGHPISHIRRQSEPRQSEMINEIERFKDNLRTLGPVLDPATIDELALRKVRKADPNAERIVFKQSSHWPVTNKNTLAEGVEFAEEVQVSSAEVDEALTDVERLVDFRDYRLMDQADCLISYRPNWGDEDHGGVEAEFRFAKATGMPRLAWVHPDDKRRTLVFQYVVSEARNLGEVQGFLETRVKLGRRFKTVG